MSPAIWLLIALVAIKLVYILGWLQAMLIVFDITSTLSLVTPLCIISGILLEIHINYLLEHYNINTVDDLL